MLHRLPPSFALLVAVSLLAGGNYSPSETAAQENVITKIPAPPMLQLATEPGNQLPVQSQFPGYYELAKPREVSLPIQRVQATETGNDEFDGSLPKPSSALAAPPRPEPVSSNLPRTRSFEGGPDFVGPDVYDSQHMVESKNGGVILVPESNAFPQTNNSPYGTPQYGAAQQGAVPALGPQLGPPQYENRPYQNPPYQNPPYQNPQFENPPHQSGTYGVPQDAALQPIPAQQSAGPVVIESAPRIVPNGCPKCECFVCECAPSDPCVTCMSCDPCPPLGNICGASKCCPNWWVRKDILAWQVEGDDLPPLVTSSPQGWPAGEAGVLGEPNTTVLLGAGDFDNDPRFGSRTTVGFWLDPCRNRGLQADVWNLSDWDENFSFQSDGDPVLARPFFNTDIDAQDSQIVAYPGLATGRVDVDYGGNMYSAAPMWRFNTKCDCRCRLGKRIVNRFDVLAGYRYLHFEEHMRITERLEPQGPFFAPGTFYELTDDIRTRNDFHGGEVGMEWLRQRGKIVLELGSRFSAGTMRRRIDAVGTTRFAIPGVTDTTGDGSFYIPSEGVRIRDNQFTVIPQARIALNYYFRPCLRVHAGYDLTYIPNVVRPSGIMNTEISGATIGRGGGTFGGYEDTDVVLQGISAGFTLNY